MTHNEEGKKQSVQMDPELIQKLELANDNKTVI